MWLHLGILALCTWVLPICLGLMPVRFMKEEHKSLGMIWVSGWMFMFAVFEVLAVPFIVCQARFTLVVQWYTVVIGVLSVAFLFLGRDVLADCIRRAGREKPEKGQIFIMIFVLALIGLQMGAAFYMQYLDGDDSFFVAASLTSSHTDTMYRFTPYYGADGELDLRHALSPVPIFLAWLSELSGIHVTILCHSYISIIFLALMYGIYHQLGRNLFGGQKKNKWNFLLFVCIWYLFGNVSIYTAESFAFTRTWQGKAMFPNLIIPMLFLWMLFMARDEMDVGEWGMLFVINISAAFTTSTGIFTVPVLLMTASVIMAFRKKKPALIFQTAACMVPGIFFGMLYLLLR